MNDIGIKSIMLDTSFCIRLLDKNSLTKEPEPAYVTNPGNVTLTNGVTSGQLIGTVKNVKAALGYLHEITEAEPVDATVWNSTPSSRSSFVFKNLQPGKKYWVRVGAIASGEQLAYSTVASQFAQ